MAITITKTFKNTFFHRGLFPVIGSSSTAMLLLSFQAGAVDWEIVPTLDVKETFSDNVRLSRTNEESDFITQVNPGISLVGRGPHLKVNTRYVMENLFYAKENDRNATNHNLKASANAELLEDHVFLDANASIDQRNISSFGPQTTDNTNITNNRTNVETYSVSPYLRNHFQNFASSEVRYTHDSVRTSSSGTAVASGLFDSKSDKIQLNLNSGSDFKKLGWGLNYSKQRIDFESGQTVDQETYGVNLRYMLTPRFSLTATEGYEKNDYLSITSKSAGNYWTAGFEWNPSRRTSIEANAGKRYFGDSYSFKANHRTRRTAWSLGYSEDVTTTRSQFLLPATIDTAGFLDQLWVSLIPDPVARQQVVEAFIRANGLPDSLADSVNFLTNRFFLQKRLQASVSITGVRNTAVLTLFDTKREAQTAQSADSVLLGPSDLSLLDKTKQVGVNALWSRKISPLTSANLNLAYTRTSAPETGRVDKEKTLRIGLTKRLQPKVDGSLEFRRKELDSNQNSSEYTENALSAAVNIRF